MEAMLENLKEAVALAIAKAYQRGYLEGQNNIRTNESVGLVDELANSILEEWREK
jgi:hypothetical protein